MKYLFIFFIICFSTYMGYLKNERFSKRCTFYNDFSDFNTILKSNVSFTKKTIPSIIESYKEKNSFCKIVCPVLNNEGKIEAIYLTEEEKEEVLFYCNNIGKCDANEEEKFLSLKEKELFNKINKCNIEKEKYKNLYIKLGFFIGLIISILII